MNSNLTTEAKAFIKRKQGPDEVIRIARDGVQKPISYNLYTAFDENPDYLGRILFDVQGYWIYDGNVLAIAEQEQVARFIIRKHYEKDH